ncbi:hypothetical protein BC829DRAFT_249659 [Chytridium lagenaria]|nr:hypothetical protein BC829DRAFT_249659 [Chytridium lagenaria]
MQVVLITAGTFRAVLHIALAIIIYKANPEDDTRNMISISSIVGTFLIVCGNANLTMGMLYILISFTTTGMVLGMLLYGKSVLSNIVALYFAAVLTLITLNRLRELGRQRLFALREALGS